MAALDVPVDYHLRTRAVDVPDVLASCKHEAAVAWKRNGHTGGWWPFCDMTK